MFCSNSNQNKPCVSFLFPRNILITARNCNEQLGLSKTLLFSVVFNPIQNFETVSDLTLTIHKNMVDLIFKVKNFHWPSFSNGNISWFKIFSWKITYQRRALNHNRILSRRFKNIPDLQWFTFLLTPGTIPRRMQTKFGNTL